MEHNEPKIVVEGMEDILEKDLKKHETILAQTIAELKSYREARTHESKKRIHYKNLVDQGKYNKVSMLKAISQCDINIRHLSDKVKLSEEKIEHHKEIVDNLRHELYNQHSSLEFLRKWKANGPAN